MQIKITSNKNIDISYVNSRKLLLNLNNCVVKEIRATEQVLDYVLYSDKISGLDFYGKKSVNVGDTLLINNVSFTINIIKPHPDNGYYLIDTEINKSLMFIFPLVIKTGEIPSDYLFNSCLYNTYLYYDKYPQYSENNHIFLTYKFYDIEGYKKIETFIATRDGYVETLEPNSTFSLFVFEIPTKYKEAVTLILEGKYHKLSDEVKNKILSFYNSPKQLKEGDIVEVKHNLFNAFTIDKQKKLKFENYLSVKIPEDVSLISKPVISNETFKL